MFSSGCLWTELDHKMWSCLVVKQTSVVIYFSIRSKNAIKDIKRRLQETSGIALYHTVIVVESLMKNCTSDLHNEVLTVDFLSVMKEVITSSKVCTSLVATVLGL